jgi:hypothetical protein
MNIIEQTQHVELSLEEAKKMVNFAEAIGRLEKNRDFRTVILDGYFSDESRRLTFLTADTTLDEKSSNAVWAGIRAIGELRGFLMQRKAAGEIAKKEVNDHLETLAALRGEDAGAGDEDEEG